MTEVKSKAGAVLGQSALVEKLYDASYSSEALAALGEHVQLLHVETESGYSGHARIVGKDTKTNEIVEIGWSWGSCDYCDSMYSMPQKEIVEEQRRRIRRFSTLEDFRKAHKKEAEQLAGTKYVTENDLVRSVRKFMASKEDEELQALIWRVKGQPENVFAVLEQALQQAAKEEIKVSVLAPAAADEAKKTTEPKWQTVKSRRKTKNRS